MRINALLGFVVVGLLLAAVGIGFFWMPYDPIAIDLTHPLAPPSWSHWFGTDQFGRDVASRAMLGARISVGIALGTMALGITAGTIVGLLAGFLRGWTEKLLMGASDVILAFPGILLALALIAVMGASGWSIILALGIAYLPSVARVVRSAVLSIREREYVEAARVSGDSQFYIMLRHVLPNALPPIIVLATSLFAWVILSESALSFLGVGVPPPAPSWGNMLSDARPYMDRAEWLSIVPGLCIMLSLLGINMLGDAIRDWLDPPGGAMSAERLLEVTGLRIEAQGRSRPPLLEGLTFDIKPGEFVALVGESGSGKTMAARAILDLLAPGVARVAGSIKLEGRELTGLSQRRMRDVRGGIVGMVFQEPMVSLNPALTIGKQLAEGLKLHTDLSDDSIRRLCIRTLLRVRIPDPERCLASYPHEFSGGMRQRIMLASVMMLKPRLLIADEPTTALDTLSQREVMELMVELARDNGVAVMLITHDLGLVARYAARVIVLEKGVLVEKGDTRQVLGAPAHPYTRKLVDSLPRRPDARPNVQSGAPVILSIRNACVDYEGKTGLLRAGPSKRVVHNVDLDVREGEIVALVGGSGSGKTTLGRAVMGLRPLSDGVIRFDGADIARMSGGEMYAYRRAAQLVFQDPFSALNPRMRVGEIVGATLRHTPGLTRAQKQARIESTLDEVGLTGFADRYPHQMSGGQRQRISIARAIASRPRLVVADEPVSALDVTIQRQVLNLLQRLQAQYGFACLFITHDLGVVEEVADRVCVLSQGRIVEQGSTNAVFDDPQHDYTRALLAATPSRLAAAMSIE